MWVIIKQPGSTAISTSRYFLNLPSDPYVISLVVKAIAPYLAFVLDLATTFCFRGDEVNKLPSKANPCCE